MSRILITGANGFAGRYITAALARAGHDVYGIVRPTLPGDVDGLAGVFFADLHDLPELRKVVAEVRPEKIVHLAAISFAAHGDVNDIYQTNLMGSRNVLEALVAEQIEKPTVLLMSSANVYGNSRGGMLDEDTPLDPVNDYAVSKLGMEFLTHIYRERLSFIVVRPFNYTGIGQSDNFLIPKIVNHVRAGADRIELGNLDVGRDFSDVRFVADACARLLFEPRAIGQIVNICSGQAYSLQSVLDLVERVSGHHMEVVVNPAFVRANEIKQLWGSRAKLDELIGASTAPALEDTLRWMLEG